MPTTSEGAQGSIHTEPSVDATSVSHSNRLCSICFKPPPCPCVISVSTSPRTILPGECKTCKRNVDKAAGPEDKIEQQIFQWLKEVPVFPNDTEENKSKREEMAKKLMDDIKGLKSSGDFEKKARDEILKFIESLPMWYPGAKRDQDMFKTQLVDSLFNRLIGLDASDNIRDIISQWLEGAQFNTEDDRGQVVDKNKITENILNRLMPIFDRPREELKQELIEELQNIPLKVGRNKSKEIAEMAEKLIDCIKSIARSSFDRGDLDKQIWSWLETVADISEETKRDNLMLVQDFTQKLNDMQSKNSTDEDIEKAIIEFLETLTEKRISINIKNKDQLANNLLKEIKSKPKQRKRWNNRDSLQKNIAEEISELIEDIPSDTNNKNDLKKKIAEVITPHIHDLSANKQVKKDIINVLTKDALMSGSETSNLAGAIINRVKGMPLSEISSFQRSSISEQEGIVKEEVHRVLDDFDIDDKSRKVIEPRIIDVLVDQIVRGTANDQTEVEIDSILKSVHVPDDDISTIIDRLTQKTKAMSLSYREQDSKFNVNKDDNKSSLTMRSDDIENTVEQEILDFLEDITSNASINSRKKNQGSARKLAQKLAPIIADPDETNKEESMLHELTEYFRRYRSMNTGEDRDGLARQLMSRLRKTDFKTSTPHKAGYSFFPQRDIAEISAIDFGSRSGLTSQSQNSGNVEQKYMNELTNAIRSWLDEINVDLNVPAGSKDIIIENLAADIIDRQKYLQVNPDVNSSHQEDLSHLKYQVFRWLNKLIDIDVLSSIMPKTESMLSKIKNISVPQLLKPSGSKRSKLKPQATLKDLSATEDVISNWMDEISPNVFLTSDKTLCQKMHDLAESIQQARLNNQEDKINDEISQWIRNTTELTDEQQVKKMADYLESKLRQKGLTDPTRTSVQDTAQLLTTALLDWLKQHQLCQSRCCHEKRMQEKIVEQLVSELIAVMEEASLSGDNAECVLTEKIINALKEFPMDPERRLDENFIHETAVALLDLITRLQIFQDISQTSSRRSSAQGRRKSTEAACTATTTIKKAIDVLFEDINIWCENLPIETDTPEKQECPENLKRHIASKLIQKIGEFNMNPEVFNDDFLYEDMFDDEIDGLLSELSSVNIKNNLPALKNDLLEKVKVARQKTQDENAGLIYKQSLRDEISKTLPPQELSQNDHANFEVLKDSVAEAFMNLHYAGKDKEQRNKFKKIINDQISKFCNDYLRKYPNVPIDTVKLNQDLYKALKSVTVPKEETFKNEVELVKMKDEVNNWLKELPLKEQTGSELLQVNKIVSVLAKKLRNIEKDKQLFPNINYDDKMQKEITKWMKKLPLPNKNDQDLNKLAEKLINHLKNTQNSRRVSASTRYSFGSEALDSITDMPEWFSLKCSCYPPSVPPCSLSGEDRAHLSRIRERSNMSMQPFSPRTSKDASVSPLPVDAGSQTEIKSHPSICPGNIQSSAHTSYDKYLTMPSVGSQVNVSPHVVVKEYYWNSPETTITDSRSVCSPCPRISLPPRIFPCPASVPEELRSQTQGTIPKPSNFVDTPCQFPSCRRPVSPHVLEQASLQTAKSISPQASLYWNPSTMQSGPMSSHPSKPGMISSSTYSTSPYPYIQSPGPCTPRSSLGQSYATPQVSVPRPPSALPPYKPSPCSPSPCKPLPYKQPCARSPCPSQPKSPCLPISARPCPRRQELSGVTSEEYEVGPSKPCLKPRVRRLGSLNDMGPMICKSARGAGWGLSGDEFWERDRPFIPSDEDFKGQYREERMRCRCKEKILSRCTARKQSKGCQPSSNEDCMKRCSKCCGVHCPYPSHMFFK